MGRMGHVSGKRMSKQHTTVIDAAQGVVVFLQKIPEVSKISLGRIDVHLPATEWRIKLTEIRGGLRMQVRGTNSIQQIMIYTTGSDDVRARLLQEFSGKYLFV